MHKLWAPWRDQYITKVLKNQHKGCVFCRMFKAKKDEATYIFLRGKTAYAVLNIYPYSNGHCMIVPNRHVNDLEKMSQEELAEMMELLVKTQVLLKKKLSPHGFNVGLNLGRVAGAGIPGHIHMHIVPRWNGDHNFMPVIAQTRVISQSLDAMYEILTNAKPQRHRRTGK